MHVFLGFMEILFLLTKECTFILALTQHEHFHMCMETPTALSISCYCSHGYIWLKTSELCLHEAIEIMLVISF